MGQSKGQGPSTSKASNSVKKTYLHGGVAGLRVGQRIVSAQKLNITFTYHSDGVQYDPAFVYFTTELQMARGYAAKAVNAKGAQCLGAVYEVTADGQVFEDEDFQNSVAFKARSATITKVLESNVEHSRIESLKLMSTYMGWGDLPMYDSEGYMLPSPQMKTEGVTAEYLKLLGPWISHNDISGVGRPKIMKQSRAGTVLWNFKALDKQHQILGVRKDSRWWAFSFKPSFTCECGERLRTFPDAVWHQLGEAEMKLIKETIDVLPPGSNWPSFLNDLAGEAQRLNPTRWAWLSQQPKSQLE